MCRMLARALLPPLPAGVPDTRQVDPIPTRTLDDYIRRVKDRWRENPLPGVEEARRAAIRRHLRMLATLRGGGAEKNAQKLAHWESNLAKLQGTEAPKTFEVSAPGGGPIAVKLGPDLPDAFRRLTQKLAAE
jgi:hypothetical protein